MAAPSVAARAIGMVARNLGSGSSLLPIVGDALQGALGATRVNTNVSQASNTSVSVNPSIGVNIGSGSLNATPSGSASGGASAPLSANQSEGVTPSYGGGTYGGGYEALGYSTQQGANGAGLFDGLLQNPMLLLALVGAGVYFATRKG